MHASLQNKEFAGDARATEAWRSARERMPGLSEELRDQGLAAEGYPREKLPRREEVGVKGKKKSKRKRKGMNENQQKEKKQKRRM